VVMSPPPGWPGFMVNLTNAARLAVVKNAGLLLFSVVALAAPGTAQVWAQDTAFQEAAKRKSVLEQLPADAAKRLFGLATTPAPGPVRVVGGYTKGCVAGAQQLPADGDNWQVMRPSRNRSWGAPVLIEFIQRLAVSLPSAAGWPGLMVGDIAQPRGGPMLTGHASHQLGIEADIWLTPMPDQRLTPTERDEISATNVVAANGLDVDPSAWRPEHRKLLETVARSPGVARIFVNPAIKKALCREAGGDRGWLRLIRPWWGHNYHFHIRLSCPATQPECQEQTAPGPGDGCGELDWWFTEEALHPKPGPPARPLRISEMPAACAALVQPR
jgi:penicillin-insensitive murein endopeptidase